MAQNPKIEMRSLDTIHPYVNNPRRNEKAIKDVATSIRKYGFNQPIVVDKEGVIVVGHTRYQAALQLGLETVPVLVSNLNDKQNKEYRIADNKTNEESSWDYDKLIAEIQEGLDFTEFDFEIPTIDEAELDSLFQAITDTPQQAAPATGNNAPAGNTAAPSQPHAAESYPEGDEGYDSYDEGAEPRTLRRVQCPHCGEWFDLP